MVNRPFSASAWLNHTNASNQSEAVQLSSHSSANFFAKEKISPIESNTRGLHSCFVPGWQGEGLLSKSSVV